MSNDYLAISSEIHELESLLNEIPVENVIDRMSLESRLKTAKELLKELHPPAHSKNVKLTFRGRPVIGKHGIFADFGSKAANFFAEAYSAVVAGLEENLRYMGPIPNKNKNQLLITGVAVGSFGFEFELPDGTTDPQRDMFSEGPNAALAIDNVLSLLKASAEGSDDDIAELVDIIHPRAVKKIAEFLDYLVQQAAWCGLEYDSRYFRYSSVDELAAAAKRLEDDNIREDDEQFFGYFQGVLPKSRTFEFKLADQQDVIKGKIDSSIEDASVLNRDWLNKVVSATFHMVQVGQGRPRYSLLSLDHIYPSE